MAGSWKHMTTRTGKLRSNESFVRMIENLGDAYEAAEECYGMIWFLASNLASQIYHDEQIEPTRAQILDLIKTAEGSYRDGLRLGGRQRER